jgi:hypothetical protein
MAIPFGPPPPPGVSSASAATTGTEASTAAPTVATTPTAMWAIDENHYGCYSHAPDAIIIDSNFDVASVMDNNIDVASVMDNNTDATIIMENTTDANERTSLSADMDKPTFKTKWLKPMSVYIGRFKTFVDGGISMKFKKLQTSIGKMFNFLRNFYISARESRFGHFCSYVRKIFMAASAAYTGYITAVRIYEFFHNA